MYRICKRCIMDTTDPEIVFYNDGCSHCIAAENMLAKEPHSFNSTDKKAALMKVLDRIKKDGKSKKYDCIIGLSGGVDSSYLAYLSKEFGLKPLAIHLDNGWNSELAVNNIENICNILDIDLITYVIDWEEFKDLQLSFLKSSTPDSEIPTDHAIFSVLSKVAAKEGIKYVLSGGNFSTESILPAAWSQGHHDWKYIKNIQKRFGSKKLKTFPHQNIFMLFFRQLYVKTVNILDYIDYVKDDAKEIIKDKLEWRDYGGKHWESIYTKIFQTHILPEKFGYDKRRAHLSSLIISGQISRQDALEEIEQKLYDELTLKGNLQYIVKKFGISLANFQEIMELPVKSYNDYPNNKKVFEFLKMAKKVYSKILIYFKLR